LRQNNKYQSDTIFDTFAHLLRVVEEEYVR